MVGIDAAAAGHDRLGGEFTPTQVAAASPEAVEAACAERPAVHRFPRAVATRLHALARMIVDEYGGDTAAIWTTAASGRSWSPGSPRCRASASRRPGSSPPCRPNSST